MKQVAIYYRIPVDMVSRDFPVLLECTESQILESARWHGAPQYHAVTLQAAPRGIPAAR